MQQEKGETSSYPVEGEAISKTENTGPPQVGKLWRSLNRSRRVKTLSSDSKRQTNDQEQVRKRLRDARFSAYSGLDFQRRKERDFPPAGLDSTSDDDSETELIEKVHIGIGANAPSSYSKILSFRSHRIYGPLTHSDLPLSSTLSPPNKLIRSQSLDEVLTKYQGSSGAENLSTSLETGLNYGVTSAKKKVLVHLLRQTVDHPTQGESRAELPQPADSDPEQTFDTFQGKRDGSPHSSSSSLGGTISTPQTARPTYPQTAFGTSEDVTIGNECFSCLPFDHLQDIDVMYSDLCCFFEADYSEPPDNFDFSLLASSLEPCTDTSLEADFDYDSIPEGGEDLVHQILPQTQGEHSTAELSLSVDSDPQQTFESLQGPGENRTLTLTRSHSSPSLSHMTSAENRTLTRAQSLPDLQLNCSCEQFTPDITADEEDETYRFQCSSPGLYQCSVTGLVFHMEREGDLVYRTLPWNRKLLSQHHKQPAGPLFDIKCEQQSVCQLHLPHCEIHSTGGADFLSVAHLDEENIEFVGPHKITETHVIINITGFSAFGNVKDEDAPPVPVQSMVLVFYRPPADPDPTSFVNLLLLPKNVVFTAVLRYRKKLDGDELHIPVPPFCKLQPQQEYSLSTCPEDDSVLVEPTTAEFDLDHNNNFLPSFQVTLEKSMKHLRLFLRDTNSSESVWERRVCLLWSGAQRSCGQSALNLTQDNRLVKIRSSFVERISLPNLKSLMDKLYEKEVMTYSEIDSTRYMGDRGDKARFVIDTVERKGAGSEMIEALCKLDRTLSEHLGLELNSMNNQQIQGTAHATNGGKK